MADRSGDELERERAPRDEDIRGLGEDSEFEEEDEFEDEDTEQEDEE